MASPQEEFTHPVIQAMQNAYEQIQKTKSTKFNQELATREADLRQAQFDEAKRQHDIASKRADQQLDINLQLLKQNLRQNQLHEADAIQELLNKGVNPQRGDINVPINELPGAPNMTIAGAGNYKIPNTDIELNPNAYTDQQTQVQRALDLIRGKTTAEESAKAPFAEAAQSRLFAQQKTLADEEFARNLAVHNLDRASAERVATMKDATDRYLGELNARTRLNLARVGLDSNDPAIDNYVNDMYVAGNFDKIPGSAKIQNAIRGSVPRGWTPLNKEDKNSIEQINVIDSLLDKTKRLGEIGSSVGGKLSVFTGIGEAGNLNQEVQGMLGTLSRGIGKEKGVLTQKDIERAKGLVYDIRQGKDGNGQKYQDLKKLLDSGYQQNLQKYPEDQRNAILTSRGIDVQRFVQQPAQPKGNTAIQLDDGTVIPDTPQNRKLHGLPLE